MAERRPCYLDTHVALWLAQGEFGRFRPQTREVIDTGDLLISPMVFLEMQYLFEIGRTLVGAEEVRLILAADHGVRLCDLEWTRVTRLALHESWTRNPFDRLIVANAKANRFGTLVSADERVRQHYPQTVW